MPTTLEERPPKISQASSLIGRMDPGNVSAPPARAKGDARLAGRSDGLRRIFTCRPAFYGVLLVVVVTLMTVFAPLFTPYGRDTIDLDAILSPPSASHVLGTDEMGRDLFTRIMYGGRFSLMVALSSIALATGVGLLLGILAGYFGGLWENLVTGAVDLFSSIPVFLVLLVLTALGGGHIWLIILVIGSTMWMETARVVRARFLQLDGEEYVEAARSLGSSDLAIVFRHMLPQALPSVIVSMTIGFAQAMLIESALSFLGFGIQPPVPTWGNMLQNAQAFMRTSPLVAAAPGIMIFVICLCFNLIGDGLRSALAEHEPS